MIVFWKQFGVHDWRYYEGRARMRNGRMQIYPKDGQRIRLREFIAFNDSKTKPPTVVSSLGQLGSGVDNLSSCRGIAKYLPSTYIDAHGNIRQTDEELTLVFMAPDWDESKEMDFQRAISVPF